MKKVFALLLTLTMSFFAASCGLFEISSGSEVPQEEPLSGTVTVGLEESVEKGNLLFSGGSEGNALLRQLMHGYSTVSLNKDGAYSYNKDVVKKMNWTEESDGGRTYIFELKDDLLFSDGQPVTAKDYVFGILLQSSAVYKGINGSADRYALVDGHADYLAGKSQVFSGVKLLSEYRFSLRIASENLPYFYEYLALGAEAYPMHAMAPEAIIASSREGTFIDNLSRDELRKIFIGKESFSYAPVVTSGPFTYVSSLEEGSVVVLTANENYGLADKASVKTLVVKGGIEDLAMEFQSGLIDVAYNVSDMDTVKKLQALQLSGEASGYETVSGEYYYLSFVSDLEEDTIKDLAMRQAIAYAIDDRTAALAVTGSSDGVLYSFAHPESVLAARYAGQWEHDYGYGYSPLLSKELLSGYDSPAVRLGYAEEDAGLAEIIRQSLTEAGFVVLDQSSAAESSYGLISLHRGTLEPGMNHFLGTNVTDIASTQTEAFEAYWKEWQLQIKEDCAYYPLFCEVHYTFYQAPADFVFAAQESEPSFGLSSLFAK